MGIKRSNSVTSEDAQVSRKRKRGDDDKRKARKRKPPTASGVGDPKTPEITSTQDDQKDENESSKPTPKTPIGKTLKRWIGSLTPSSKDKARSDLSDEGAEPASPEFAQAIGDDDMALGIFGISINDVRSGAPSTHSVRPPKQAKEHVTKVSNTLHETEINGDEETHQPPAGWSRERINCNVPGKSIIMFSFKHVDETGPATVYGRTVDDMSDPKNPIGHGILSEYRVPKRAALVPGQIIRATHAFANTDQQIRYPDRNVCLFPHGPVFAKTRPMIILWNTLKGMVCVPLFSLIWMSDSATRKRRSDLVKEYIPITTVGAEYKGEEEEIRANGAPLRMTIAKDSGLHGLSYVDISRPIHISRNEAIKYKQARLERESYVRLMELFTWRENHYKTNAFRELGLRWPEGPALPPIAFQYHATPEENEKRRKRYIGAMNLPKEEAIPHLVD